MPPESETTESTAELAQLKILAQKFHLDLITAVDDAMLAHDLAADLPVEWARAHAMLPIRPLSARRNIWNCSSTRN